MSANFTMTRMHVPLDMSFTAVLLFCESNTNKIPTVNFPLMKKVKQRWPSELAVDVPV